MNKKLLQSLFLGSGLLLITGSSFATKHMVMVANNTFTLASMTVSVGDTVQWMWAEGVHNTTSGSIPAGAASWGAPIDNANQIFEYAVTQPGNYTYTCTFHPGMNGSFTATPTTTVGDVETRPFSISPNPAKNSISFKGNIRSLAVNLYDLNGRKLTSFYATNISEKAFSIQDLSQGMYILDINVDGKSYNEKLVVNK